MGREERQTCCLLAKPATHGGALLSRKLLPFISSTDGRALLWIFSERVLFLSELCWLAQMLPQMAETAPAFQKRAKELADWADLPLKLNSTGDSGGHWPSSHPLPFSCIAPPPHTPTCPTAQGQGAAGGKVLFPESPPVSLPLLCCRKEAISSRGGISFRTLKSSACVGL